MATLEEVYSSMCDKAQQLIDIQNNDDKVLSEVEFDELQRRINRIHLQMEEFNSKYRGK
ncbi:MAG: hypothetical protein WCG08_14930 [Paludibacter sp.]